MRVDRGWGATYGGGTMTGVMARLTGSSGYYFTRRLPAGPVP
jgi:hypothetical protein